MASHGLKVVGPPTGVNAKGEVVGVRDGPLAAALAVRLALDLRKPIAAILLIGEQILQKGEGEE